MSDLSLIELLDKHISMPADDDHQRGWRRACEFIKDKITTMGVGEGEHFDPAQLTNATETSAPASTNQTLIDCRKAYEEWTGKGGDPNWRSYLERDTNGEYILATAKGGWIVWQYLWRPALSINTSVIDKIEKCKGKAIRYAEHVEVVNFETVKGIILANIENQTKASVTGDGEEPKQTCEPIKAPAREGATPSSPTSNSTLIESAYQIGLAAYAKAYEEGRLPDDCVYACVKAALANRSEILDNAQAETLIASSLWESVGQLRHALRFQELDLQTQMAWKKDIKPTIEILLPYLWNPKREQGEIGVLTDKEKMTIGDKIANILAKEHPAFAETIHEIFEVFRPYLRVPEREAGEGLAIEYLRDLVKKLPYAYDDMPMRIYNHWIDSAREVLSKIEGGET